MMYNKVSPDMVSDEMHMIAKLGTNKLVDGFVVSNTTLKRGGALSAGGRCMPLVSDDSKVFQEGGLSGAPLKYHALDTLKTLYRLTNGQVPIIGVGGISTGLDAYERIRAGASLVQVIIKSLDNSFFTYFYMSPKTLFVPSFYPIDLHFLCVSRAKCCDVDQ